MKPEYWLERWQTGRTGFHLQEANPRLVEQRQVLADCIRVLLPLCGKSADLEWLAVHGFEVVGVELSELAAQAFFSERGFTPERGEAAGFVSYRHGPVTIWVGDFFAATEAVLGSFDAVYDRAAMIALPEELRRKYVAHLPTLLTPRAKLLLLTLFYDAEGGPPFSVSPEEVVASYPQAKVTLLQTLDAKSDAPGPVERGASFVQENVHLVEFPDAN